MRVNYPTSHRSTTAELGEIFRVSNVQLRVATSDKLSNSTNLRRMTG